MPGMSPYFRFLKKEHEVPGYTLVKPKTDKAKGLELLLDAGNYTAYQKEVADLAEQGRKFVQTENGLEEMTEGSRFCEPILF